MIKNEKPIKTADEIQKRFIEWRKNRRPSTPIPPVLWDGAVELAKEQGIGKTAKTLGLDYNMLKKRVNEHIPEPPESPVPQFVELLSPLSGQIVECILEVESNSGARMKIDIKNFAASNLTSIIREFVR